MKNSSSVAVVGAGVIGLCWSALFATRGYQVHIFDPRVDLDDQLMHYLTKYIQQLCQHGEDIAAISARVHVHSQLGAAIEHAQYIQESGPESIEFKQDLWHTIEKIAMPEALFLSSSSGITAQEQGEKMQSPHRIIIGHPFNPPHIMPLVEVSSSEQTSAELIEKAMLFYRHLGKVPVHLEHEKSAFVANRLQMALVLEAIKLVDEGVVDMRSLDEIVTQSLGIRWASIGPLLAFHLGGGDGGLAALLEHIGVGLAQAIGQQDVLTPELIARIGQKAEQTYPPSECARLTKWRDIRQQSIISQLQTHKS